MVDPWADDPEESIQRSDLLLSVYLAVLPAPIAIGLLLGVAMSFGFAAPAAAVAAAAFIPPCPILSIGALARAVSSGSVNSSRSWVAASAVVAIDLSWTGLFLVAMAEEGVLEAALFGVFYALITVVVACRSIRPGGALRAHELALIGSCVFGVLVVLSQRALTQGSVVAFVLAVALAAVAVATGAWLAVAQWTRHPRR